MVTKQIFAALVLAMSFGFGGCTVAKVSGAGSRPLYYNAPNGAYDVLQHFEQEEQITFDYTSTYEINRLVAKILEKNPTADAVINLRTEIKNGVGDFMMNVVTCGFARASTLMVHGDVIKFKN